jgi:hypothetical protein
MKSRWLARIMGGIAALVLVAAMFLAPVYSGILNSNAVTAVAQGNCDCSKCSSNQYCCPTANGYCGCFPMACPN